MQLQGGRNMGINRRVEKLINSWVKFLQTYSLPQEVEPLQVKSIQKHSHKFYASDVFTCYTYRIHRRIQSPALYKNDKLLKRMKIGQIVHEVLQEVAQELNFQSEVNVEGEHIKGKIDLLDPRTNSIIEIKTTMRKQPTEYMLRKHYGQLYTYKHLLESHTGEAYDIYLIYCIIQPWGFDIQLFPNNNDDLMLYVLQDWTEAIEEWYKYQKTQRIEPEFSYACKNCEYRNACFKL
ncbi:MAG: PD-(D/E)XK nuclease family protein [Nanopusillaceae archaeon]